MNTQKCMCYLHLNLSNRQNQLKSVQFSSNCESPSFTMKVFIVECAELHFIEIEMGENIILIDLIWPSLRPSCKN